MQNTRRFFTLCAVATCTIGWGVMPAHAGSPFGWQHGQMFLRVGHEGLEVDRALKRYSGMITALGDPDEQGHIYSFRVTPLPPGPGCPLPARRILVPSSTPLGSLMSIVLPGPSETR